MKTQDQTGRPGASELLHQILAEVETLALSTVEWQEIKGNHQLLEFTQTHVHRVSDAIQPSHPLSSPFPPALNLSQHQGLF